MKIGLDLDNTLVSYDRGVFQVAKESNLIESSWPGTKKELRDRLRVQPGGELEWQKLQGLVYGSYMSESELFPGVANFS